MRHFLSYGDDRFKNSKIRIEQEAKNFDIFDTINIYCYNDLPETFRKRFDFIFNMKRGGGYYIWKPFIIYNMLQNIKINEILVYLDSGCTINKRGIARYLEYEQIVKDSSSGILATQLDNNCLQKFYTTNKIFQYFNVQYNIKITDTPQIQAGILIIRKCENSEAIIKEWLRTVYDNPLLFTDFYSVGNPSYFIDNRHDQSIFSIIMKIMNGAVIPDETWDSVNWENLSDKPFWATRIRN